MVKEVGEESYFFLVETVVADLGMVNENVVPPRSAGFWETNSYECWVFWSTVDSIVWFLFELTSPEGWD